MNAGIETINRIEHSKQSDHNHRSHNLKTVEKDIAARSFFKNPKGIHSQLIERGDHDLLRPQRGSCQRWRPSQQADATH